MYLTMQNMRLLFLVFKCEQALRQCKVTKTRSMSLLSQSCSVRTSGARAPRFIMTRGAIPGFHEPHLAAKIMQKHEQDLFQN